MSVRYVTLLVRRNVMETIVRTVPLYEAPILEAIHGGDALKSQGEIERDVPMPDVKSEFNRLVRVYGRHDESGLPMVEYVYGRPTTGALENAIKASIAKKTSRKQDEAAA